MVDERPGMANGWREFVSIVLPPMLLVIIAGGLGLLVGWLLGLIG